MSKEMKDFLSQFMNQPEPKAVELKEKNKVEKKESKPKTVKATVAKKTVKTNQPASKTEGVGEQLAADIFLQTVNNKKFLYDKKKNLQIDDYLYSVLNLLKQHEDIKSIATLLNAIIEKFIEDNKSDLKRILSRNPLT